MRVKERGATPLTHTHLLPLFPPHFLTLPLLPPFLSWLIIARTSILSLRIFLLLFLVCLPLSPLPPPLLPLKGQLNVTVLCLVTGLARMGFSNEPAFRRETEGDGDTHHFLSTYWFLSVKSPAFSVILVQD